MAGDSSRPPFGPPGVPRWVKVSAVVVAAIVLLLVLLAITGVLGGQHGPRRHAPGREAPAAGVEELPGGHRPPVDHGP